MQTTLYELMQEIRTFANIDDAVLQKAKQSEINTSNNKKFKGLLREWVRGTYDEDPQYLAQELEWLVN
jgi:hypothetical protein